MDKRGDPSLVAVGAGCAVLVGMLLVPLATVPGVALGSALWFAGVPRVGCIVVVVAVLAGVAGLSVVSADRSTSPVVTQGGR